MLAQAALSASPLPSSTTFQKDRVVKRSFAQTPRALKYNIYIAYSCKLRYTPQVGICWMLCLWARGCVATPAANERNIAKPPDHQIHILFFLGFKEEGEQGLD